MAHHMYYMIVIIELITNSFLRRFSIRKTSRGGFWFDGLSASMSMTLWKKRFLMMMMTMKEISKS